MGCWNGTCGISNLPIIHGEEIVLYVIKRSEHARTNSGGYVYPYDQFAPIAIPVYGKYNDYGGIEDIIRNGDIVFKTLTEARDYKGNLLQPIEKELKRHTDFMEKTAKPSSIDELLNDFIERGIYENIGFMMIRKDIHDTIIHSMDEQKQKFISGAKQIIDAYQLRTKVGQEEVNELKAKLSVTTDEDKKEYLHKQISKQQFRLDHIESDFEFEMISMKNPFARNFFGYNEGKHYLKPVFMHALQTKDMSLMEDLMHLLLIEYSMYDLRKGWGLQAGAGSQNDNVDLHMDLAVSTIKSAIQIKHHWSFDDLDDNQDKKAKQYVSEIENLLILAKSRINDLNHFINALDEE